MAWALLGLLPLATRQAHALPSTPDSFHADVQERSGDLFIDTVFVYWRPLFDDETTQYEIKFSTDPQANPSQYLFLRNVQQDRLKPWLEVSVNVVSRRIYDHERVYFALVAKDAGGAAGPPALASAALGELPARRGDVNEDGERDLQDAIALLLHLFTGTFEPSSRSKAYSSDINDDSELNTADVLFLLRWLFVDGPEPAEAPPVPRKQVLLGSFQGEGCPMYQSMTLVTAMEAWQRKKQAVVNVFSSWTDTEKNQLFGYQLKNLWNNGNVPMISWQPNTEGSSACVYDRTSEDIEVEIAAGNYDAFIRDWATKLKTWLGGPDLKFGEPGTPEVLDDRRAYIRLAHEMNGWWTPWNATTGGNAPGDYVALWRHVHDILVGEFGLDGSHVQWVWCVNNLDADTVDGAILHPAEQYYPGDPYVDWVSVDGYNWGLSQPWTPTWDLPANVFNGNYQANRMLNRLRVLAPGKPICIAEYGTTSVNRKDPITYDVSAKASWITDMLNYSLQSSVGMVLYFNRDKETDWAVFGGARGDGTFFTGGRTYNVYSTYKKAVASNVFITTNASNPRLLTDAQFQGQP